ncbi:MAG: hypothetical protein JWP57_4462 [Spirosoma sp.]|nr:hypothetical protein [Spirosoma sp.]
MSHIIFAGQTFYFSDDEFDRQTNELTDAAEAGKPLLIELSGESGPSRLLWTPGAPIVLNGWDTPVTSA